MKQSISPFPLTPAHLTGFSAMALALPLGLIYPVWAAIPLALFVSLCLLLPFFPRSLFFLPVLSRGNTGKKALALTFDDGPDPSTTPLLLDVLSRHAVKATFFVIGEQALRYPDILKAILAGGHDVGNHSCHHDSVLMLRKMSVLREEIASAQRALQGFGIHPAVFRPPVGITNPRLGKVLRELDLICVTFSCRGFDLGNRWVQGLADRILKKIRPDDILLLHDVHPPGLDVRLWLQEVERILTGVNERGYAVLPLTELIGTPVMKSGLT